MSTLDKHRQVADVSNDIRRLRHNVRLDHIHYFPIDSLGRHSRRLRKRSDQASRALQASVTGFGIVLPILIDGNGTIVAGEGIVDAAKALGHTEVPTLRIDHLDESEVRLLRIALNKLGEQSEWDKIELAAEFGELLSLDIDLNYEITGFETPEIDNLVHPSADPADEDPDDAVMEVGAPGTAVSRLGDIWRLGQHRVLCGSSLEPANLQFLTAGASVAMVLADQPYNVKIAGNVSGLGKKTHREFAVASGEMSEEQFVEFLTTSVKAMAECCGDGSLLYLFMDWKHMWEMLSSIRAAGLTLFHMAVWVKKAPAMGAFLRSQHELCFIAKKGTGKHRNNIMLGRYGRSRSNCWFYPGVNSFGPGRAEQLEMHPTCKNVAMLADAIRDATNRGEIVLDGFLGSGSTLIAAERTSRICHGVELDPLYVDVIVKRWERATGRTATLEETGELFGEVAERRAMEAPLVAPLPVPIARPDVIVRPRVRAA